MGQRKMEVKFTAWVDKGDAIEPPPWALYEGDPINFFEAMSRLVGMVEHVEDLSVWFDNSAFGAEGEMSPVKLRPVIIDSIEDGDDSEGTWPT